MNSLIIVRKNNKCLVRLDNENWVSSPVNKETDNRNFAAVFSSEEEALECIKVLGNGEVISL